MSEGCLEDCKKEATWLLVTEALAWHCQLLFAAPFLDWNPKETWLKWLQFKAALQGGGVSLQPRAPSETGPVNHSLGFPFQIAVLPRLSSPLPHNRFIGTLKQTELEACKVISEN